MGPVQSRASQEPDRTPVQPGVHPVSVIFYFVKPFGSVRRLVNHSGQLWFDPTGEGRCFGPPPIRERSCHVLDTITLSQIDPGQIYRLTCRMMVVQRSTSGSTVSAFAGENDVTTRATPESARRFTRSRSSLSPNEVISMEVGSRPASRAISRNFGRTSATSPRAVGIQPSP